jgi:hypothetical protein
MRSVGPPLLMSPHHSPDQHILWSRWALADADARSHTGRRTHYFAC